MGKIRYGGHSGEYRNATRKELLELLKDVKIPYKSKMTRYRLIKLVEKFRK